MIHPIGSRVKLIPNPQNLEYFLIRFQRIDINQIFKVVCHLNDDCIFLDCKPSEGIAYDRFELVSNVDVLPEELFVL